MKFNFLTTRNWLTHSIAFNSPLIAQLNLPNCINNGVLNNVRLNNTHTHIWRVKQAILHEAAFYTWAELVLQTPMSTSFLNHLPRLDSFKNKND
jgi:hypothetical protein